MAPICTANLYLAIPREHEGQRRRQNERQPKQHNYQHQQAA